DSQCLVERLLNQSRHVGVVSQVKARVDASLERKLAQKRQAERVDRRDRDFAEAPAQVAPPGDVDGRGTGRLLQALDNALTHLGGGLAREGDGEDVVGIDAGEQQVDVALDQ